ncbi:PurM, N-terminal-like protein [Lactifluus volemus]|nr:PurM, N-terminal-like protein [Lactifluus volemus]
MLILQGSSALSIAKPVISVDAVYVHLVHTVTDNAEAELLQLGSPSRRTLNRLLSYGDDISLPGTRSALEENSAVIYVLPRPGSVSPWSSKATDISRLCNLGAISNASNIASCERPSKDAIFLESQPASLRSIDISRSETSAREKLERANKELGLALASDEIDYLVGAFISGSDPIARSPTDAELFMFAQVNSEHCRHKIFNASWTIDGTPQPFSLFQMIRNTEKLHPTGTISAYSDNAAVFEGALAPRFGISPALPSFSNPEIKRLYRESEEEMPVLIKVETHNHPTAVSPYPGAATGSGGEIRDEGSVGRGSRPKAGLTGFSVSNLLIPGYTQPWEEDFGRPAHIASALDIMIEGPLGAAAFNNEFGRPALTGYFRTFAEREPGPNGAVRGYHKPIMLAGGLGTVRPQFAHKSKITPGAKIVVLGGPGMLIGLGGGAASSQALGTGDAGLDFASVQRDNAEMQRRCQQVIDACIDRGVDNPIQSIHDVGAGGLSNALPELVHDSGLGATFEIRNVPLADASLSPMEIWCNESQERYVLAVDPAHEDAFHTIATRERCPFAIVGLATEAYELVMSTLFGKPPRMTRSDSTRAPDCVPFDATLATYLPAEPQLPTRLVEAVTRVLRLPSVGSKAFLITIGDRSITGLVTRDQMVGPWQVPVADVAVTRTSYGFDVRVGEAMALGERTPLALLSAPAAARMAVAEALTNLAAARIRDLGRVKLSANWMSAASMSGEGAALYAAVRAVGMELCPALGVGIPVGKDSMSMAMRWRDGESGEQRAVTSPLSLIVTAFAGVEDIGTTWTPQLRTDVDGPLVPDVEDPQLLKAFFNACQAVRQSDPELVLAYHDRSDGEINLDALHHLDSPIETLFNEELESQLARLVQVFIAHGFASTSIHVIGKVVYGGNVIFSSARSILQQLWADTSFQMQSLRDDPECAAEEFALIADEAHSGLTFNLTFTPRPSRPLLHRPKGVNGQAEMAWAFTAAGFDAWTRVPRARACGGFSYGDVLGAGAGWAHAALLHEGARNAFKSFFAREDAFALVLIPGSEVWPLFKANRVGRFEARVALVEVVDNSATQDSVFLRGMGGSRLAVAVAHGEGRVEFAPDALEVFNAGNLGVVRYVDGAGNPTEVYPLNPNGSPGGLTGVQTPSGRVFALMPHPERVVALESNSWYPPKMKEMWGGVGPWFRLFQNAREWCG